MTLMGAINHLDAVKPNGYGQVEKIKWLSNLDGRVKAEIIDTHEGGDGKKFSGYDETTALTQELLIPFPYDEVYIRWLEAQIDYANGEYGKYNNSITLFNTAYTAYEKFYNKTHRPLRRGSFGSYSSGGTQSGSSVPSGGNTSTETGGNAGVGISSIKKTATSGLVDTYTIAFTNGTTSKFTVTNGKTPEKGVDYYTEQDKEEIVRRVLNALPNGDEVRY